MKLLLDSHALLWWFIDDPRLSTRARAVIADPASAVFVSAVSAWEIALKGGRDKLPLPPGGEDRLREEIAATGFRELVVTLDHALLVRRLEPHHTDPFDRLLVAQCHAEGLTLVTSDRILRRYAIATLW